MEPKIIAFHLPQFHCIPENDKWWGKGFTEWTSVKNSEPLYEGHYQPKEPLNNTYYNLLDPKIREWQADLAKKYGIYGFCYYHYWFRGKKLLEKPIEEILKLKVPNLPFCLSWANESWSRTWYGNKKELLIKQEYGEKEDWEKHFKYLLKYFKDERYIKINNKPILLIYKPLKINCLDLMVKYWNELALTNGFNGIYIIETLTGTQKNQFSKISDAVVFYEPSYTFYNEKISRYIKIKLKSISNKYLKNKLLLNRMDYNKIYQDIIKRDLKSFGKDVYIGSFVDYDDTPRRKYRGFVFDNSSPKKFQKYLSLLLKKSQNINSEYLFVTAWNEWAEGAYLEPDKRNDYNYLKAVKKSLHSL